jgi:hypothetical protein
MALGTGRLLGDLRDGVRLMQGPYSKPYKKPPPTPWPETPLRARKGATNSFHASFGFILVLMVITSRF